MCRTVSSNNALPPVKLGIFPYVEAVFGWDDEFQRERLTCAYQPQWFSWILQGGERVGLLCSKPYEDALYVHLLIIFPQYQGRQLGAAVMVRRSVRENAV